MPSAERSTDGCREPGHARKSYPKDGAALQQVVFQSVAGRRGSGGHSQLAVDRAHMGIDGNDADDELFGNLRARQALSEQTQDLDFTCAQPIWTGGGSSGDGT